MSDYSTRFDEFRKLVEDWMYENEDLMEDVSEWEDVGQYHILCGGEGTFVVSIHNKDGYRIARMVCYEWSTVLKVLELIFPPTEITAPYIE